MMARYVHNEGKIIPQRQSGGKIMKGIVFPPPAFQDLTQEVGLSVGPSVDARFTESNRGIVSGMVEKVPESHKIFGHFIGMIRWGQREGLPLVEQKQEYNRGPSS